METRDTITLEATGEFPFTFLIEKAEATEKGEDLIIEGVASTTNIDHDKERMSKDALLAMEAAINDKGVPLRVEHAKEGSAIIGTVYEGRVDERNQLHIKARLDPNHPVSSILHHSIQSGVKMGLSVGGIVKRAVREFAESVGGMVKTFYDVALQEVSVTPRPANFDSWLVTKSIAKDESDAARFADSPLREAFLFENPRLDYLQVFAKSIPDKAWRKVANKDMEKIHKAEESEATETAEKTAVSRREFDTLSAQMGKGFKAVMGVLSKMTEAAVDQRQPDEDKTTDVGEEWSGKADGDAVDQEQPTEEKPTDVGEKTRKTEADGSDLDGEKENKARKADDETESEMTRTIKALEKMSEDTTETKARRARKTEEDETDTAKAEDETETDTAKAEDETDTAAETKARRAHKAEDGETETTKMHDVDRLVLAIGKAMVAMGDRMEKSGTKVYGFEKSVVNELREDPTFQAELAEMVKTPGFKKSVSMGKVYVPTKDGQRLLLSYDAPNEPTISKSRDGKTSFRDMYKTEFSSLSSLEE